MLFYIFFKYNTNNYGIIWSNTTVGIDFYLLHQKYIAKHIKKRQVKYLPYINNKKQFNYLNTSEILK